MKASLWIIGSLLAAGLLLLSYLVRDKGYEYAINATGYTLALGLPLLFAFIGVFVLHLIDR